MKTETAISKTAKPIYTAGKFDIVVNPVEAREVWTGNQGEDYIDNYLVIHKEHLTVESRHENIFTAYAHANKLNGMMEDNMHIYVSDPIAKQMIAAIRSGNLVAFGVEPSDPEGGTVLTGDNKQAN